MQKPKNAKNEKKLSRMPTMQWEPRLTKMPKM